MDLTLATREVDGRAVVAVGGEIDVYTAPKLRDRITELVGDGSYDIVIDMEAVEFLDSTGLGVLVGGLKKVRAHDGSLELVCTQDRLLKIFRITGLAKVFVIHDSVGLAPGAEPHDAPSPPLRTSSGGVSSRSNRTPRCGAGHAAP